MTLPGDSSVPNGVESKKFSRHHWHRIDGVAVESHQPFAGLRLHRYTGAGLATDGTGTGASAGTMTGWRCCDCAIACATTCLRIAGRNDHCTLFVAVERTVGRPAAQGRVCEFAGS